MKQSTDTNERVPLPANSIPAVNLELDPDRMREVMKQTVTGRLSPNVPKTADTSNPELYTNPPLPFNPELESWEQFCERVTARLQREARLQHALDQIEGEFDTEYAHVTRVEEELKAAIKENIQLRRDEMLYALLILCLLLVLTGAMVWISQQPPAH